MLKNKKQLLLIPIITLLIISLIVIIYPPSEIAEINIENYDTSSIDNFLTWEYYLGNATCTDFPYVADFDGDDLVDILFRAQGEQDKIYVGMLNVSDGSLKWMIVLNESHPYSSTYLDYGNFYDDPPLEIVIGVSNHIYLISGLNGSILANFSLPSHGSSFSYIYAVDIDGDSLCEAIYQLDNRLYAIDFVDNRLLWSIPIGCYPTLITFYDIDKDGYREFFYTAPNGIIIGYKLNYGVLWCVNLGINSSKIYMPVVFGNNNTTSGLFIINNSIICIDISNGELLWTVDLSDYFKEIVVFSPTLIDFDKDGLLEIFMAGFGGENEFIALNELGEIEFTVNILDELVIPLPYSNIVIDDIDSDNEYEILGLSFNKLYIVDLNNKIAHFIYFRTSPNSEERHSIVYHNGLTITNLHGKEKIVIVTTLNHILSLNITPKS